MQFIGGARGAAGDRLILPWRALFFAYTYTRPFPGRHYPRPSFAESERVREKESTVEVADLGPLALFLGSLCLSLILSASMCGHPPKFLLSLRPRDDPVYVYTYICNTQRGNTSLSLSIRYTRSSAISRKVIVEKVKVRASSSSRERKELNCPG